MFNSKKKSGRESVRTGRIQEVTDEVDIWVILLYCYIGNENKRENGEVACVRACVRA